LSSRWHRLGLPTLIFAACLIPLVPVALVPLPPLLDYPNHLARLWLIAGGATGTPLEHVYAVDWSLAWVNIGIDLVALVLGPVLGADAVGRICIALAMLLPALGFVLLGRVMAKQWHPLLLLGPVLTMNSLLALGFLNHQIAVGLALLFAAGDTAWRAGAMAKFVPRAIAGALISIVHPFGAFALATILASLAMGQERPIRAAFVHAVSRAIMAGSPAFIGGLALAAAAPHLPGGDPRTTAVAWVYSWGHKLVGLLAGVVSYDPAMEFGLALILGWLVFLAVRRSRLRLHAGLLAGILGCITLVVALPSNIGDASQVEMRLGALALTLAALALLPGSAAGLAGAPVLAFLSILIFARTGYITYFWREGSRDIAAVEEVLAFLPRGTSLLSLQTAYGPQSAGLRIYGAWSPALHFPTRAVPLRQAFVPTLFSAAGKQPLRVLRPWASISVPEGGLPEPHFLLIPTHPTINQYFVYLADWRERFGYILLLNADGTDMPVPGVALVADRGFARLYRIMPATVEQ
jgi:hypothetical protein